MRGQRAPRVGRGRGRVTLGGGGSDDATTAPRGGPSQRRALPAAAAVGRADSAPRVLAGSARHARKPRRADRGRRGQAPADATDDAMVLATPPTTVVAARAAVAAEDLVTRGAGRDLPSARVAAAAAAEAEAPRRALSRSHVGGGGGGHERRRQHLAARYEHGAGGVGATDPHAGRYAYATSKPNELRRNPPVSRALVAAVRSNRCRRPRQRQYRRPDCYQRGCYEVLVPVAGMVNMDATFSRPFRPSRTPQLRAGPTVRHPPPQHPTTLPPTPPSPP